MNEYLREFEFEDPSLPVIRVCQNPLLGHAGTVWDAALVLCAFIESAQGRELIKDTKCVELGAGTAIVSIAAKTCGADKVVATDIGACVSFMKQNIGLNGHLESTTCSAQELDWFKSETIYSERYDWILCADCVYAPETIDGLIKTIITLNPTKGIIVSNERREHESNSLAEKVFIQTLYDNGYSGKAVHRDVIRADWRCEDIDVVVFEKQASIESTKGA